MKQSSIIPVLLGILFLCATSACDRQLVDQPEPQMTNDMISEEETSEEISSPVLKPDLIRHYLDLYWEQIAEQEQKLLATPRLDAWMADLRRGKDLNSFQICCLDQDRFDSLTPKECLYYRFNNPEFYSQNCSGPNWESGTTMAIYAYLPGSWDNFPSVRQDSSIVRNLEAIKTIVLQSIDSLHGVSPNMLELISDFQIKEATLPLIQLYEENSLKDDLILTVLVRLMRGSAYDPWTSSPIGMALERNRNIPLAENNILQILSFARQFAAS